ncbi:MAG: tetratricopeptide repeat protein, partial [Acidithiobacillales bacterium]
HHELVRGGEAAGPGGEVSGGACGPVPVAAVTADVLGLVVTTPGAAVDSTTWPIPDCAGSKETTVRKSPLLLLMLPGLLVADVVYLKGGGKFTGRIVEQTAEKVVVDFGDGTVGLPMDQVEEIARGPSPLDEFDARASKLGQQDVDGWRSLAQWASMRGLSAQSRAAYKRVLAVAPDDAEAREALGFVKLDGRWVTEEESYRARGFVRYDGEWMTPAEVQLAQSNAAREQAREEADKRASDAQFKSTMDRLQKQEDEKRAQEEADRMRNNPVYWGGWGYGMTYWPNPAGAPR